MTYSIIYLLELYGRYKNALHIFCLFLLKIVIVLLLKFWDLTNPSLIFKCLRKNLCIIIPMRKKVKIKKGAATYIPSTTISIHDLFHCYGYGEVDSRLFQFQLQLQRTIFLWINTNFPFNWFLKVKHNISITAEKRFISNPIDFSYSLNWVKGFLFTMTTFQILGFLSLSVLTSWNT